MSPVFFSIIIPTYNRAALVAKTVDSLLKQQFREFEIILIDDGGSDNTKEMVEGIGDSRVKYFWKENGERGAARNFGLDRSSGKWINFFDSDDIAYPNHLQVAHDIIIADPALKIFHTSYDFMDIDTGKIKGKTITNGKLNKKIHSYNNLSCNNVFLEKELADRYRFSEKRCLAGSEDWLLWLQLSTEFEIMGIPKITTTIILHSGRSMVTALGKGTENRAECFMEVANQSDNLRQFRANIIGEFYSLAALCYAVERKRKDAMRCSRIAIGATPSRIFSRRFLATIKHLL